MTANGGRKLSLLAAVTGVLLSGTPALADLPKFTRRLTAEQAEPVLGVARALVATVVDAAARTGMACRLDSASPEKPDLERPKSAVAVPGGFTPNFPIAASLKCDAPRRPGQRSSVRPVLVLVFDRESRENHQPPAGAVAKSRGRRWTSGTGELNLWFDGSATDAAEPLAAIRIMLEGPKASAIADAVDEAAVIRALDSYVLIQLPRPSGARPPGPETSSADEEKEVVRAVVAELAGGAANVVVSAAPVHDALKLDAASPAEFAARVPDVDPALLEAFAERQKQGALPALPPNAQVVEDEVIDKFFETGSSKAWDRFYQRFEGAAGHLKLSPVALNRAGDRAMVVVNWRRGFRSGLGVVYVLQRDAAGRWAILYEGQLWIS